MKKSAITVMILCLFAALAVSGTAAGAEDAVLVRAHARGVLQEGEFPEYSEGFEERAEPAGSAGTPAGETGAARTEDAAEILSARLEDAVRNWETSVDVSDLGLDAERFEADDTYADFLNAHPDMFYVSADYAYTVMPDSLCLDTLIVEYSDVYNANNVSDYNAKVAEIVAGIEKGWSEEQKVLYLHDYLVTHCQYDLTFSKYDAYDAIIGGHAVCNGYSLAFSDLLEKAGMKGSYVSSVTANHAWNVVYVDGKQYFVDCTWDDPCSTAENTAMFPDYCRHINLLRSREGLIETGHKGSDWTTSKGKGFALDCSSTKYDNYYWSAVDTAIVLWGDKGYYHEKQFSNQIDLSVFDYSKHESEKTLSLPAGTRIYYAIVKRQGDLLIVGGGYCVYAVRGTDFVLLHSLTDEEREKGWICGLDPDEKKVRYNLFSDWLNTREKHLVGSGYADLPLNTVPVTSITAKQKDITVYDNVGTVALSVTVKPSNATCKYLMWSSSDTEVASVDPSGNVTIYKEGDVDITVRTFYGSVSTVIHIHVIPFVYVTNFNHPSSVRVLPNEVVALEVTVTPEDATDPSVTYTVDDPTIATVDENGNVRGVKTGVTIVHVKPNGMRPYWNSEGTVPVFVVRSAEEKEGSVLFLTDAYGLAGDEVTVDVYSTENYVPAFQLKDLTYDTNSLAFIGFENLYNDLVADNEAGTVNSDGQYIYFYGTDTHRICTLRFRILDGAKTSSVSASIVFSYSYYTPFTTSAGTVTVLSHPIGDVNGDNKVTSLDRLILTRCLAGWKGYEKRVVSPDSADINRDGKITATDRLILSRYLAGWKQYEPLFQ